jgi:Trk K+ transport system NAD-binding subunit
MMLRHKVAVICGAGTVGNVVARALVSEGAKLLLWFLLAHL